MRIYAVSMMRDEADICESLIRHLVAQGVDGILVADNRSADGTRAKIEAVARELQTQKPTLDIAVMDDPIVGYYQYQKITALSRMAKNRGADVIIPCDADELWFSRSGLLRDYFTSEPEDALFFSAELYDFVPHDDSDEFLDPVQSLTLRREKSSSVKVAFRAREDVIIDQGSHNVVFRDFVGSPQEGSRQLYVRHYPHRGFRHFLRKVKNGYEAYRATDLSEDVGEHWREWGSYLEEKGEEEFRKRYLRHLVIEPGTEGFVTDPFPGDE